jgi:hypothetical protein
MVINKSHSGFQPRHGAYSRVLSMVLLAFVCYGTTVEAAHRHGRVFASADATSASGLDNTSGFASSLSSCNDCLICQLHQSFSTAVINVRSCDSPELVRSRYHSTATVPLNSRSNIPQCGRAPPVTS